MAIKLSAKFLLLLAIVLAIFIQPASAGFTEQDLTMTGSYTFTGTFIDSGTGDIIPVVHVSDTTGYSYSTTAGTFSNAYDYGTVTFTFTSALYPTTTYEILMSNDTVMNITLTQGTSSSVNTRYYTPQRVRFVCKDYRGHPIQDMAVSAVGIETTLGSLDWFLTILGINLDDTPVTSTLMSGVTGNDGSITFLMIEVEKYRLNFSKPSQGIGEFRYYYPSKTEYNEIFWTEEPIVSSSVITATFYNTSVDPTIMTLGIDYQDQLGTTDNFTFVVQDNQSNYIYRHVYPGPLYIANATFDLHFIQGETYYWGYLSNSTQYEDKFNETHYITFQQKRWLIDPMGAAEPGADAILVTTAALVYNWAAVGFVFLFALIFSRFNIKFGIVIVPLIGALFKYIGWLEITWLMISVALGLGVLLALRYGEEEAGL